MSDPQRFWLKVAALMTPVCLLLALPSFVLWRSGEFVTADEVADRILAGERIRYSQECTNQWRRFKLRMALSKSPNVLVLGGSSSLQIRGDYFQQPSYNAAGSIGSLWHAAEFLRRIGPSHVPRVLVIGIHPYMLLGTWKPTSRRFGGDFDVATPTVASTIQFCTPQIVQHLWRAEISLGELMHQPWSDVGLQTLIGAPGVRPDGSHDRGKVPPIPERFASQLTDARQGANYLPFGDTFAPERVADLRELLDLARTSNMHVVAYVPPVATVLRDLMVASAPRFAYVLHAFDRLAPIFAEYGVVLFDGTDLRSIGATDDEMLDATHPSETADLRLLLRLVARDQALRAYVDEPRLRGLLAAATPLSVFRD